VGATLTGALQIPNVMEQAPTWLFVALYILAVAVAITAALARLLKTRAEENRAWEQAVTGYLALGPGKSGRLPTVAEVSPYQLVHIQASR
jgi:hypothetical protein